jgi:hypothetical protein
MNPLRSGLVVALSATAVALAAGAAELSLKVEGTNPVVMGGKIEFRLETSLRCRNPYDPDELQMDLEVTTPSGAKKIVPAFHLQPCEWRLVERGGRRTEWIYPSGPAGWRARYSPDETGPHTALAVACQAGGRVISAPLAFVAAARPDKGSLRLSRKDPRFLEFSDGRPFFAIGQNIAFVGLSQYVDGERAEVIFKKLAENGANFARVWTCCEDWATALEARKSAWGRSWSWRPPFVPWPGAEARGSNLLCVGLGGAQPRELTVSPSHPVGVRLNQGYKLTARVMTEAETSLHLEMPGGPLGEPVAGRPGEWIQVERSFTTGPTQWWLGDLRLRLAGPGRAWLTDLELREASGGPNLLWEAEVNRPARGVYNQPDSLMLDRLIEAAGRHGIFLHLCLLTRDLYRPALKDPTSPEYRQATVDAKKLLRYAVARWGWSRQVAAWEYFNEMDPNAPTVSFYGELGEYLEKADPYHHLRATSAWGPAPMDWKHPRLDLAELHHYLRPTDGKRSQDEVAAVLDRTRLMRTAASNKPALLAEFGLADDKWGLSPYMRQDKQGVHFHNSLWASAFSGLAGTTMFWWWESLDQQDLYYHYRPLAAFLADAPFTSGQFQPVVFDSEKRSRVLAWRGPTGLYGWVFNPQATWHNQIVEKKLPTQVQGDALVLPDWQGGAARVEWWDTGSGQIVQQADVPPADKTLRLSIPAYVGDIACKVTTKKPAP